MRMSSALLASAAFLIIAGAASEARAEPQPDSKLHVSLSLETRYLDTLYFNEAVSDEPALQASASYDLTEHVYVSAYAYTGFTKAFRDDSSEYGFELGVQKEVAKDTTLTVATGRYANYWGQGFDAGDTYVRASVQHGPATASVSVLKGMSNTALLNFSYDITVAEKVTLTPSIAYISREERTNFGLTARYWATDHLSVGVKVVLPEDYRTGSRKVYAAAMMSYRF